MRAGTIKGLALAGAAMAAAMGIGPTGAKAATVPHILQQPAISRDLIAFGYAGDLWTVPIGGGANFVPVFCDGANWYIA